MASDLDDYNNKLDDFENRVGDLESNATADVLADIKDNGVYVSDRWRFVEASNNDLLLRDTQSSGQPSYRFTAGERETFGTA